ncbi:MAG: methyltransferase domain-containing protein, partial [Chloroflexi bacterium]|nr:methyltransferase domain-containing protein [Chloroflexota bacterium]
TPSNHRHEQPSTYVVSDYANKDMKEELTRLRIQDEWVTASMGGVLPEQSDPASFQRVLDVGCGTGGWLVQTAKAYPTISMLIGVDLNDRMLKYAQAQAAAERVSDRVQFVQMDVLRELEFPIDYFDLVNQRFAMGYLRTWDWPNLLKEFERVTRPGGVIRLTEGDVLPENTSPALTRLYHLLLEAFHQSGHLFTPESDGLTGHLARFLQRFGLKNIQTRSYTGEGRAGTSDGQRFYEDMSRVFRTHLPFLRKWTRVPDDYEQIYQQALNEMQQPDFVVNGRILTVWGNKPG